MKKYKNWSDKEIKHAKPILDQKRTHDPHMAKVVFWSALVVIVFANLLVSVVLIPFLVALNKLVLYSIIAILAGVVGFLYKFLVMDIGHLERKYHLSAAIIIPLIALGNVFVMVLVSNRLIEGVGVELPPHNPWLASIVFAMAFVIPYISHVINRKYKFVNNRYS